MTTHILTIDPAINEIKFKTVVNDSGLNAFAREWIGDTDLDHGGIAQLPDGTRLMIIVYGAGLIGGPKTSDHYFTIGKQLFNGKAVIYAANQWGDTVDVPKNTDKLLPGHMLWAHSKIEAETLIIDNRVDRPTTLVNGTKVWEWSAKS